jgi:hypothetical protein
LEEVIRTNDLDSPIRQWVSDLSKWVDNIIYSGPITDSASAQQQSLAFASNLINYFLSLVSFIALVYLIYHWYLMVTAAWDKSQFEKWQKWLKYATIAIAWIFLSWFVISMVFRVLEASTWDVILIQ